MFAIRCVQAPRCELRNQHVMQVCFRTRWFSACAQGLGRHVLRARRVAHIDDVCMFSKLVAWRMCIGCVAGTFTEPCLQRLVIRSCCEKWPMCKCTCHDVVDSRVLMTVDYRLLHFSEVVFMTCDVPCFKDVQPKRAHLG